MPNFGNPEAGWTDTYDWTRYRGPQPYPCPGAWVLGLVEGDGIGWRRYPEHNGDAHEHDDDVLDEIDADDVGEVRGDATRATLINELVEFSQRDPDETSVEHRLSIAGEDVFRRVDPTTEDLFGSVAEALARFDAGEAVAEFAGDVEPTTGRPPAGVQSQREIERRESENRSLEAFGDAE